MVNVPNIERVIASLEGKLPETRSIGFNMGGYVAPTSSILSDQSGRGRTWVACIAGHAYLLATHNAPDIAMHVSPQKIEKVARAFLDIPDEIGTPLFFDLPEEVTLCTVSLKAALAVLNKLKKTGVVDWSIARSEAYAKAA